jgi:hypothetical protein
MRQHLLGLAVAILTFIFGCSIAAVVLGPPVEKIEPLSVATPSSDPSAWTILLASQNRDLLEIDGSEKAHLQMAIDALRTTDKQSLRPRLFAPVSTLLGESRYVLVEESPLLMIPGDSRLQVSVFDHQGKLLDSSDFGAGWRIMLTKTRFVYMKSFGREVLEVESRPWINGADVRKQYYTLIEDRMRLIRLEGSNGDLRVNFYGSPNHTIGFTEVGRSAEDWEKSLITKDEAQSLVTLTWLGGDHLDAQLGEPGYYHEDLSEARLVEEVRARPAVKQIVNALKNSRNKWLREAARSAAEQMH